MRKRIDGHAHIIQLCPVGWTDPLIGVETLAYGRIRRRDGVEKQRLPAFLGHAASFPVEMLVAVLDEHQVEKAVVMAHLESGICETACDAITKYPDRLAAAVCVPPQEDQIPLIRRCNEKGIRILKFEQRRMAELYPGLTLADPAVDALLEEAERLGMVVAVDTGPSDSPGYRPDCLKLMLERHPALQLVICHMGCPQMELRNRPTAYRLWKETVFLGKSDRVWFDVTAMPDLFSENGFPYPEGMTYLKELYAVCGADRLIWGTDMPGTFRNATYTQMIQAFEQVDFLTEREKDKLFYENANRLYFS